MHVLRWALSDEGKAATAFLLSWNKKNSTQRSKLDGRGALRRLASCGPGRAKVKAAVTLRAACVSGRRETDDDKKKRAGECGAEE